MWIDKYQPLYGPETEAGADGGTDAGPEGGAPPPPPMNERPVDGPGSGRSELRKQLETGFEKSRKDDEKRERAPKPAKNISRARQEGLAQEPEAAPTEEAQEPEAPQEQEAQEQSHAAPDAWTKEARAEWEHLPPAVQAAVAKREADMAKGVEDLKAKHSDMDKAIAPRMELIKRHNQTPAAAVNQLFAWFEALSANPVVSFPALAESFKFDLRSIPGLVPQAQQPQLQQQVQQEQKTEEEVPSYVKQLEQKIMELQSGFQQGFGQLNQTFQQEQWNKTKSVLDQWAKDKPHFSEVRATMGQFINSGTVPPLPDGNADLDKAYDMALWALPEIRAQVLAEQQKKADDERKAKAEKEKKAQQEAVDKARRANGGSLSQSAPGAPAAPAKGKSAGKSVRESLMEARKELSEG